MPIVGWAIVAAIVAIFTVVIIKKQKEMKAEYELKARKKAAEREAVKV